MIQEENKRIITVGKPYIKEIPETKKVRLCSELKIEDDVYVAWYEVDEEFKRYLCRTRRVCQGWRFWFQKAKACAH